MSSGDLRSFRIDNRAGRLRMNLLKPKLMRQNFVRVTWIDINRRAHDFLAQYDGQRIRLQGVGTRDGLIFVASPQVMASHPSGFSWFIVSGDKPEAINLYPNVEAKILTNEVLETLIQRSRMVAMSVRDQWAGAKRAAWAFGTFLGLGFAIYLALTGVSVVMAPHP